MATGIWGKIGLGKPEHREWAMYDWANSAFMTCIISALFPPFFVAMCAKQVSGLARFVFTHMADVDPMFAAMTQVSGKTTALMILGFANAAALAVCAVVSPAIGAHVDQYPVRKKWLAIFTGIGSVAAALLAIFTTGNYIYALLAFVFGQIAINIAFVIYDGFLPHITKPDELDSVSAAGYAIGYVGGGILLGLQAFLLVKGEALFGITKLQAIQISFVSVGIWWALFSLPFFKHVKEPPSTQRHTKIKVWRQLFDSARDMRAYPQAFAMLLAFLIYNDGIGTMQRMASAYGEEIGLSTGPLITALLLVQFLGIPATFIFGAIASRVGTTRAITGGLIVYCGVTFAAYFITTATHFFMLAIAIGLVQGGTQSLSRALFASLIPKEKAGEFFGVFAVFERFAGIIGPLTMSMAIYVFGGSRPAILSIGIFFVVGILLLQRVNVEAGRKQVEQL